MARQTTATYTRHTTLEVVDSSDMNCLVIRVHESYRETSSGTKILTGVEITQAIAVDVRSESYATHEDAMRDVRGVWASVSQALDAAYPCDIMRTRILNESEYHPTNALAAQIRWQEESRRNGYASYEDSYNAARRDATNAKRATR